MNIRLRNIPKFLYGGMSGVDRTSSDWYNYIHSKLRLKILDFLTKYGIDDTYGNWLNSMQTNHAKIWNAATDNGDWLERAYQSPEVQSYQNAYLGKSQGSGIKSEDLFDYNTLGILNAFNNNIFYTSGTRTSGDNPNRGYVADGLYSSITDFRRLLGRKGDFTDLELLEWQNQLNKVGWETYLDKDNYYKLRRLNNPTSEESDGGEHLLPEITVKGDLKAKINPLEVELPDFMLQIKARNNGQLVRVNTQEGGYGFDWAKLGEAAQKILDNPNFHSLGRLLYNINSNNRIYNEAKQAIRPNLIDSYKTHRRIEGDEASKLAYYRRAAEGVTKASRPMTSDADRQMAYQMEALGAANELRTRGDLIDNQMIQKTSDESNQHLWANIQRDNLVATTNRTALNDYNARLHNLEALRMSANSSSINNAWLEYQTRLMQKLRELQALQDLIFALELQQEYYIDPKLNKARQIYQNEIAKYYDKDTGYDTANPKYQDAVKAWQQALLDYKIRLAKALLQYYNTRFIKSGGKITRKRKDDLLYKSAKDVVEHFRRMTKLSYDSINKKHKDIKLASHPKGSTKKYLLGGVAPFLVYTPAVLGGETTTTTGSSTTSTKKSSSDDGLDLMKELFKSLQTEGLPSDVNRIYRSMQNLMQLQALFGNELSTEDLASMYIQQMQQINTIKFNKTQFDKALELIINRDAGDEYAMTNDGKVVVLNLSDGLISFKKIEDVDGEKEGVLTNNNLLNLRAYGFPFSNELLLVANNATSLNEISKYLKAQLPNIGTSEETLEGYSKKDSNDIKAGLQALAEAPDGIYKVSEYKKSQAEQALKALNYLYTILPRNMRNLLEIHTGGKEGALELIATMIGSTVDYSHRLNILALTGKASTSDGSKGGGEAENSAGLAFVLGQGPRELIDFNTGTSNAIRVLGIKGVLLTKSKENLGLGASLLDATKSQQGGYLEWSKATFGGSRLNSGAYSHIILNDSTIMGMDLPYTTDFNGNEIPDFQMLRKVEEADQYISENNITDINQINEIYLKHLLPPKYIQDGKLNTLKYKRFAAIQATLDEDSLLDKNAVLSDEVSLAGDVERSLYEQAVRKTTSDKNYNLSDGMFLTGWWSDKLYKGTIFIPYSEDIAFAALSSGEPFKQNLPDTAATILLMLYASKAMTYKAPETTLSQIKGN